MVHGPIRTGPKWSGCGPTISGVGPDQLWLPVAPFGGQKPDLQTILHLTMSKKAILITVEKEEKQRGDIDMV
jgi:hypothetical protein